MKSNTLNKDFLMIAKTMHGLEDVLAEELKAIGVKNIKKGKRAIEFYGNQETKIGGRYPYDIVEKYGPEEYLIKKAMQGTYTIAINYYGSESAKIMGPTTVFLDVYTNWGRDNEKKKTFTLRLDGSGDAFKVATIDFNDKINIAPCVSSKKGRGHKKIRKTFSKSF